MTAYDVIVLGLGAMGSATAFHGARRGRRILGLDAYEPGHTRGASHGRTRAIREAHFEAPEYVPLVQRAYALWRELEAASGRRLGHAYNLKTLRVRERAIGEQAERAYQTLVAHWRPQPRKRGTGAANAARR